LHGSGPAIPSSSGEPLDLYFLTPSLDPELLGTLDGYEVREVIGEGGMGIVLQAFEPALHRPVAIKVLAPALAGSATARRRFTREAQAAAAVCHEHIVAVHGVHETQGLPYLVMQYIPGESLQARLDRVGPLGVLEVVRIGMQTASGLAAAHAQGLIHRDIKPANLLLENGLARVKITDFGLARMADDVALTQPGVVAGTPEYMAPEQARGESVDHRADLFSLGSVLYAMTTGRPPFRGSTTVAVLRQVSDQEPRPLRELNPDIPEWLEALIRRLMIKNPELRIQSAAEVAVLLEGYLAHLQQPTTRSLPELAPLPEEDPLEGTAPRSRRGAGKRRLWLALLMGLVALGVILSFRPREGGRLANQAGQEKEKPAAPEGAQPRKQDHLAVNLRAGLDKLAPLTLSGPDVEDVARSDDQGLRVTLPAGRDPTNPIKLEMPNRLQGDFDITLGYDLLAVGGPTPQYGVGVMMRVWFETTPSLSVLVSRTRKPVGELFSTHRVLKGPDDKEQYLNNKDRKATAASGKLRLVRTGSVLRYLVAEGGLFQEIQSLDIGTHDVVSVQMYWHTMYKPIVLDARFTELDIWADRIGDGNLAAPDGATSASADAGSEKAESKGRLVVVGGLVLILGVLGLSAWLSLRRRLRKESDTPDQEQGAEAPVAVIAFACSACGKTIRAAGSLAGKKVKCRQCSQVNLVPSPSAIQAERPSE
jgi:hypothetical protein